MPELPEVEVLVRHLRPLILGKTIRGVEVRRARVVRPNVPGRFESVLRGATFEGVERRGKYLLFTLRSARGAAQFELLGHLGMTGRMYLVSEKAVLPKHAAVVFDFGSERFVFEDTRYFGRMALDTAATKSLGPEPLLADFNSGYLFEALRRSNQPVKVKLMDQALVAGVGNIYASEALHRAGISPVRKASRITEEEAQRLWRAIRFVLRQAIRFGSTVPLDLAGTGGDGLSTMAKNQALQAMKSACESTTVKGFLALAVRRWFNESCKLDAPRFIVLRARAASRFSGRRDGRSAVPEPADR